MRFILLLFFFALASTQVIGKVPDEFLAGKPYRKYVLGRDSLYDAGKFPEICYLFELASNDKHTHFIYPDIRYASCCFALAGNNRKAIQLLYQLRDKYQVHDTSILSDKDYSNIYTEPKWLLYKDSLIKWRDAMKAQSQSAKFVAIRQKLEAIGALDLGIRSDDAQAKAKADQHYSDSLMKQMHLIDEHNYTEIHDVVKRYGWPNPFLVGDSAAYTVWSVLQHNEAHIKEFFPLLKAAAFRGIVSLKSLALTIDRIRVFNNQQQLFGTQLISLDRGINRQLIQIEAVEDIEFRLQRYGMGHFKDWLNSYGMTKYEYITIEETWGKKGKR